ncbi:hypothetical protein WDU94_002039, partial [Cyamophila willieti]
VYPEIKLGPVYSKTSPSYRNPHISAHEHCSILILIWNMHYLMLSEYPKIQFKMSTLSKVIQNKDFFTPNFLALYLGRGSCFGTFFYRIHWVQIGLRIFCCFFMTINYVTPC